MPRRPMLFPHLSEEALRLNYRQCKDSADRTRWQALWLLAQGSGAKTQREVGQLLDRSHTWVGRLVRRYNAPLTDPRPFPPKNERESRRAVRPPRWMPRAWLRWTMHLNTKVRPVGDFVLAQLQHCLGQSGTYLSGLSAYRAGPLERGQSHAMDFAAHRSETSPGHGLALPLQAWL